MKIDDSLWDVYDSATGRATVGDQLRRHARNQPRRTAIAHYDESGQLLDRLSYAELDARVNRTANSLQALGVGHRDVVAIMSRNSADYVVAYLAAAKLGAVTTGINFNFRDAEIEYQIGHAEPTALVVEAPFVERIDALGECLESVHAFVVSGPTPSHSPRTWHHMSELYADHVSAEEPTAIVHERDVLFLIYTSGTEAFPKAVMIPHRNYAISTVPAWSIGAHGDDGDLAGGIVRSHDRWLFLTPLHTIAGLGNLTIVLSIGGTIVLPRVVDAELSVDLVERERVTAMVQTPTFFLAATQTARFAGADLSSIERLLTYGGTMPRSMIEGWNAKAPKLRWATYWGQSELTQLGSMGWFRTVDDIPGGDTSWIGRPVGPLELQLVDEDGNVGNEGEAWCRTPSVMLGYYKDPERTAETFEGGWLHTGDIMRRDEDGNLYFLDRRKDMIKTGGYNVSSQEVERTLYSHPACRHVAVVGLPDEYWSEAVTAFVVAAGEHGAPPVDEGELIAYCKERLVNYKVPKRVIVLDALPVDGQGKVLKRELRRIHSQS